MNIEDARCAKEQRDPEVDRQAELATRLLELIDTHDLDSWDAGAAGLVVDALNGLVDCKAWGWSARICHWLAGTFEQMAAREEAAAASSGPLRAS